MFKHVLALAAMAAAALPAHATLTAGDIAIIGRINNGTPDSFAVVALSDIALGEVIYFTDNGWTGSGFRTPSATDGDGNENLTKWTVSSAISAGTIVLSTSAGFATSGSIAGASSGTYASLALNATGDQITAFQGATSNPLNTVAALTPLYTLDDTNGFENATDSGTGNVAPGLTAGVTALSLNQATGGSFHVKSSVLAGPSQTKAQWLATFANSANWDASAGLPTGSISVTAVPEPESYALMLAGLAAVGFMARRRAQR